MKHLYRAECQLKELLTFIPASLTCICVLHAVTDESMLELRTHETVSISASIQDPEVDLEHEHIE